MSTRKVYYQKYYQQNKPRILERNARWRRSNQERMRKLTSRWYKANKEHCNKTNSNWYRLNKEKRRRAEHQWRKANPDKVRIICERYRARKRNCKINDFTVNDWYELLQRFNFKCAYCKMKKKVIQEHIIPLCRGGNNTKNNVVPACVHCNGLKGTKTLKELGWKLPRGN